MKLIQVFLETLILLQVWPNEGASTCNSGQANRKQKNIIERSMNLKVNPCDDFYEFACGKWNQVFSEIKYIDPISMLDYNVNKEMSGVFKSFTTHDKPKFIKEAYKYYKSCKSLKSYHSDKYFQWLIANDQLKWSPFWTTPRKNLEFDWVQTLAKMRTYGLNNVFIQQIVLPEINYVKSFYIDLDKPDGGFKPMHIYDLEFLMNSMRASYSTKNFDKLWQEIMEFEQKLQQLDEIEDVMTQRLIYAKDLPFDWLKNYVKIILNQTELDAQMKLYIQNIPYMEALDKLLKTHSQHFICKYLEVRLLWHLHRNRPAKFVDEYCLANTRNFMPTAMHWLYEQQHPELAQEFKAIYKMFNNVRNHFNNTLIKNKYDFNATVIQYLQNKINKMKLRLNNIPRTDTIATLDKFYKHLNLDAEKFHENHLKLLRFNFQARLALLNSKTAILDFTYFKNTETDSQHSPYFVPIANYVFVPLTLLQPPIYSPDLDDIYKYSSLGFILSHEIFHGFDDYGLLRGANGSRSLRQFEGTPLFKASFNCLLKLYPSGIAEKISDVSGLRYAYQAFFDANPNAITKTQRISGSKISLSKVFFLNFAQLFCRKFSDHGSHRERVNDVLTHFPEFAKTFNCSSHHRLYPHDACHLWR